MNIIKFVNPSTGKTLQKGKENFYDESSKEFFPIVGGIPRFCELVNYSESFGFQWHTFDRTQLDSFTNKNISESRFYAETDWKTQDLVGSSVLEVGSGAGRFSEVFLRTTKGHLYSIDYSRAVEVNLKNNQKYQERLHLAQASIYKIPFPDNSFDKIFCLGVLQHTSSFEDSVRALVRKAKIGGEIVVDFYPIKGWYTKAHAKYILRPITRRLPKEVTLQFIRANITWMLRLFDILVYLKLGVFTRFIPITDVRSFPVTLSVAERLEWALMDTFDGFSPEFDNPQRLESVVRMFTRTGCRVTFADCVPHSSGVAAVVRAVREG